VRRPPTPLDPERAWDFALRLLGRQAYTAAEVVDRLRRRGLDPERAGRIVARLQELGLLDDRAYAVAFVQRRGDERGRNALRSELRRKGVAEALVEGALDGGDDRPALDDAQQAGAAAALLRKHAWRFAPRGHGAQAAAADEHTARHERQRLRARAAAFLARRGFAPDVVAEALAGSWGDDETT